MGTDFVLDPFIFDRVEIIRGPAASLYGTSAFFGVVNVITKSGSALAGGRVAVDAGTLGSASGASELWTTVDVRARRRTLPRRWSGPMERRRSSFRIRVRARWRSRADLDGEQARQVAGRIGVGALTVSAAFGTREKNVPTAAYGTAFGDPRFRTTDTRAFLDARYTATAKATRFDFRGTLDRYRYAGEYPTAVSESDTVVLDDYADGVWAGIETRASRTFGSRHDVTAGVEFRDHLRQRQGGTDAESPTLRHPRIGRHNGRVRAG